jgi:poly-gamma-glutamate synthesis protein (capsule biosynthesis protein)
MMKNKTFFYLIIITCLLISQKGKTFLFGNNNKKIIITFGGDFMIDYRIYKKKLYKKLHKVYKYIFHIFQNSELNICNLEAPISKKGKPYKKEYIFFQPRIAVNILKKLNIKAVSLANNHILDYGISGFLETLEILKKANIKFFGAGKDIFSSKNGIIFDIKGEKIAILGFSNVYPKNFFIDFLKPGVIPAYLYVMKEAISKAKEESDLVIVFLHWGKEYHKYPTENQIFLAHKVIEFGADIIIGQHTHNIQPIEIYKNRIIFYSIGNLIFTTKDPRADYSLIVKLIYTPSHIAFLLIPIITNNNKVNFSPKMPNIKLANKILKKLAYRSYKYNTIIRIRYGIGYIFLKNDK